MSDTTNARFCANCACVLLQPVEDAGETRTARVEDLLRRNHPLLDVELSAFCTIVEDARATLENLDLKIVQAQEILENLRSGRQRAQSRLEDAQSLLHPIRSLPNELLVEIFGHCISEISTEDGPDSLDPEGAPWLLTRVSHRWRELAVNTPQLWTYPFLDFDKHAGYVTDRQCAYKVGLFLERSRGLPMTIRLEGARSLMDHPVLPALKVSIPRWRHLDVGLPRSFLQCLSGNNFSILRTLTLCDNDVEGWNMNVDVFKSASVPVLRALEVSVVVLWRALEHVELPWSHLSSIKYALVRGADDLNILRTSTSLEDLNVVIHFSNTHSPLSDIIPLPKLRRLSIIDASNGCKEFFCAFAIPALSELTLRLLSNTSALHLPTSPVPLENLTKLDISCRMNAHAENTEHLLKFLALTHRVEWLSVHDNAVTHEFVGGLNLQDGSPARLPCLRVLDIGRCGFTPPLANDLDSFFTMLYSRLPTVKVEGRQGGEEMVDSCIAGRDGTGKNAPSNEMGDPRSRLELEDHRRCLKMLRLPRWLYVATRMERRDVFLELTSRVELECAVTMRDLDS